MLQSFQINLKNICYDIPIGFSLGGYLESLCSKRDTLPVSRTELKEYLASNLEDIIVIKI
jgi:hypothetical protein